MFQSTEAPRTYNHPVFPSTAAGVGKKRTTSNWVPLEGTLSISDASNARTPTNNNDTPVADAT